MAINIPVEPSKYVLKVYNNEAAADIGRDSDALLVVSSTDPTIDNSTKINDAYTINRKYYYRIESNETVSGIEIDWDDGEDNSDGKGNRELKTFTEPKTTGVFEHYYTKHKTFFPLIRVRSRQGVYSKWYTPFSANNDYRELEEVVLPEGGNNNSKISIDSSTNPRIPIFKPANLPPLGVLKADKNKVYAGIDNKMISSMTKPWVFAYYPSATFTPSDVVITYENGIGQTQVQTITPWTDNASYGAGAITAMKNSGSGTVVPIATNILPSGIAGGSFTHATNRLTTQPHLKVKRILKIELKKNLKGTSAKGLDSYSDRVFIKVFDRDSNDDSSTATTENANSGAATSETMAIVSLGNPIVEIDDFMSTLNVDGSESITRASNRNISTYYFDDDKLTQSGTTWAVATPNDAATQAGQYISVTASATAATSSTTLYSADDLAKHTSLENGYVDNYFNTMRITFLGDVTSALANKWTTISDYENATGTITLATAVGDVAIGDTFVISNLSDELSDELDSSLSNGTVGQKKLSYTFKHGETLQDDDGRYHEDNKLIRLQVQDDATPSNGDNITKSKIEHWQPYKYNNEVARSFSVKHAGAISATGDETLDGTTLTFTTAVTDANNEGKYIAVSCSNHSTQVLHGSITGGLQKSLGGHPYNNKWIWGFDPVEAADESSQLNYNYEILKLGVNNTPTNTNYTVTRGALNTRPKGWHGAGGNIATAYIMDDSSYNVRNVPSREVDRSLLLFTNSSGKTPKSGTVASSLNEGSTNWRDCSVNNNLDNRIIFGGATHSTDGAPSLTGTTISADASDIENFILLAKDKKFDRIHFRMKNSLASHSTTSVKPTTGSGGSGPSVKIVAFYAAPQTAGSSTYVWKPLKIIDGTTIDSLEWSSLYKSGTVAFDMPNDWIQTTAEGMYGGSEWSDLVDRQNSFYEMGASWSDSGYDDWEIGTAAREDYEQVVGVASGILGSTVGGGLPADKLELFEDDFFYGWQLGLSHVASLPRYIIQSLKTPGPMEDLTLPMHLKSNAVGGVSDGMDDTNEFVISNVNEVSPLQNWEFDGYAILIGILGTAATDIKCQNIWTYNNSHSKSIKVVDPHHVSLNDIAVAQSISFGRKTRFRKLESRLGLADIEKIGAEGGSITFGGVDLGSDSAGFNLVKSYQQKATPVFLDITHENTEITRFFGVIINMTEDHPTGMMTPKWGVTMELSYILELDSNGLIISDGRIPLGGRSVYEPKYSLYT